MSASIYLLWRHWTPGWRIWDGTQTRNCTCAKNEGQASDPNEDRTGQDVLRPNCKDVQEWVASAEWGLSIIAGFCGFSNFSNAMLINPPPGYGSFLKFAWNVSKQWPTNRWRAFFLGLEEITGKGEAVSAIVHWQLMASASYEDLIRTNEGIVSLEDGLDAFTGNPASCASPDDPQNNNMEQREKEL